MKDGSVLAQLGATDMRLPIQLALTWPERLDSGLPGLDLAEIGRLEFFRVDERRYPLFGLARQALSAGDSLPVALNAANEVAVAAFLEKKIFFADIPADRRRGHGHAPGPPGRFRRGDPRRRRRGAARSPPAHPAEVDMVNFLGTILAFVIVFFVVTFVHEFGHFFMARRFGVRVDAFSFGIGPRLFGVQNGKLSFFKAPAGGTGTDYRVSLVPVICYVKLLGEGMFEKDRPLAPDDLMAKTRGQRFLIMGMGSVMNILLAVVLVAVINGVGTRADEYLEERPVIGWIETGSPAEQAGLRVDDEIVSIAGHAVKTWSDVQVAVGTRPDRLIKIEVRRDGQVLPFDLRSESVTEYQMGYAGFQAKILTQVQMVVPDSPAEKAGLKRGTSSSASTANPSTSTSSSRSSGRTRRKSSSSRSTGQGSRLTIPVTPRREGEVGKIGIAQVPKSVIKKYPFFGAIGQSVKENLATCS